MAQQTPCQIGKFVEWKKKAKLCAACHQGTRKVALEVTNPDLKSNRQQ
jgi:hypothetical protein